MKIERVEYEDGEFSYYVLMCLCGRDHEIVSLRYEYRKLADLSAPPPYSV